MKQKAKHKLFLNNHAVVRFVERAMGFDFTGLKLKYAMESNFPSLAYVKDKDFVRWICQRIDMTPVRQHMEMLIEEGLDSKTLNLIYINKHYSGSHKINGLTVVFRDNRVVTVWADEPFIKPVEGGLLSLLEEFEMG